MELSRWYSDWQNREHVAHFDFRSTFSDKNLLRDYESFNDIRLLKERLAVDRTATLLEVGCATGEFYRYLRLTRPNVAYVGVDISRPAIERARGKYPQGRFTETDPQVTVTELVEHLLPKRPEIVYSKDVIHHQTKPFEFVAELVNACSEFSIFRGRTRDVGKTELDPDRSCQYHYGGWMPYLVMNLDELIAHIQHVASPCDIVVYRHYMILGGQHNRYLPKDCYLKETGTAETAIGVFRVSGRPGQVVVKDQPDQNPRYGLDHLLRKGLRRALNLVRAS